MRDTEYSGIDFSIGSVRGYRSWRVTIEGKLEALHERAHRPGSARLLPAVPGRRHRGVRRRTSIFQYPYARYRSQENGHMSKLTKAEAKAHGEALLLLEKDELTDDDRIFIMENWQESANHVNSIAGAFFTPHSLAMDAALDVYPEGRIIDLCAGIGSLSLAAWWRGYYERRDSGRTLEMVCVELNPEYVEIGRKMLPEAEWICGSIFDLPDLGHFTQAISNPPFGNIKTGGDWRGKYTGSKFEYRTIEIASQIADCGMFIIPQQSAGFQVSGRPYYERRESRDYLSFSKQTGIELNPGVGVDTSVYDGWHGVSPVVEIACADFTELEKVAPVTELPVADGLDFGEWEASA